MTLLEEMAERLGATFKEEMFRFGCKVDVLPRAILAVAQCAAMGMYELLNHKPIVEEEPLTSKVGRVLQEWKPPYIDHIKSKVEVAGRYDPHVYDYASFPNRDSLRTVGIKVLRPTGTGQFQASAYAYLALDMQGTIFEGWKRLAVIAKSEQWARKWLNTVEKHSSDVIVLKSGEEERISDLLPPAMTSLTEARVQ